MVRVDIETILMAAGPVPSVVVLRERGGSDACAVPTRALSIQTGSFEAAAISRGIDEGRGNRPLTHDLLLDTLAALEVKLERVEINRVDAPLFFARIILMHGQDEIAIDARPSDAIALAVRANAPIYVEDDVMNRAGTVSVKPSEDSAEAEALRFDEFVQALSPDDF